MDWKAGADRLATGLWHAGGQSQQKMTTPGTIANRGGLSEASGVPLYLLPFTRPKNRRSATT